MIKDVRQTDRQADMKTDLQSGFMGCMLQPKMPKMTECTAVSARSLDPFLILLVTI